MENKFFMHRIKHNTSGSPEWDKGIEVHDAFDTAKGSYHAYLGAYAYGKVNTVDYISCKITDIYGYIVGQFDETWIKPEEISPEEPAEE